MLSHGELLRKCVHVGAGAFALTLRWLEPWQAAGAAMVALAFNSWVLHRLTARTLLRPDERERGQSRGILLYPIAVLGLIVIFHRRLELAAAAWGLLAFGDGMATLAGRVLDGPKLPWNSKKSWNGFIAFILWGAAASAFLLRWTQASALERAPAGSTPAGNVGATFLDDFAGGAILAPATMLVVGCLCAAILAAVAESLDSGIDDNLLVPAVGGGALFALSLVEPARLVQSWPAIQADLFVGGMVNAVLAWTAWRLRSVDRSGAVVGWIVGTALFTCGGWRGFLPLLLFFALGSVTTRLGWARKAALELAQEGKGRRGARHALANVSVAVSCAFLALATPHGPLFQIGMLGALATASFDTVASEIGQAYGRRAYLVTTLSPVPAGTPGALSAAGTGAGLVAALLVAALGWALGWASIPGAIVVVIAAFLGATFESVIGATVESRLGLSNDLVNLTNTLMGAGVAMALAYGLVV